MAVLSRDALEGSPLADLHVLARELGIDGFRRLRKADLVEAIIARQAGEEPAEAAEEAGDEVDADVATTDDDDEEDAPRRRGRRGGRRRRGAQSDDGDGDGDSDAESADEPVAAGADEDEDRPARRSRGGRGGRGRRDADADRGGDADAPAEDVTVEGTVELLGNGSGFLRVSPPDPSDDDVYVSAAQVRRCELVTGDRVAGPVRSPRRSERYPSLVRVDTINGRSADEVAEGTPFDDLPAAFPTERLALGSDDPTLKAIEWLTPIGRGSRVTLVGGARAGKTEALRRLAGALGSQEDLDVSVVLAGVRAEELPLWREAGVEPVASLTLGASPDAQAQAIERAVETAKRIAARGGNAVVLVDTLSYVETRAARRILAPARNIVDGGSLTIVATADLPLGGETTVIALDPALTSTGRLPALDLVLSGALKPELLVGDAGADAIAQARAAAQGS
jgi:transcription termination factor Rho